MNAWSGETGGSQEFWRRHNEIRRIGGMLGAGATPREVILLGCWQQVIEVSDAGLDGSLYEGRIRDLALFAVDNRAVNAWAVAAPERSAIVLSRGMLTGVADALASAIALSAIFDSAYPRAAVGGRTDVPDELAAALAGGCSGPGLRGERIDVLYQLYCRVASLVLHHEMAHLARRHLSIAQRGKRLGMIDEALQLGSARFGNEQVRFIEFDADVHALDMMLWEEGLRDHDPKTLTAAQAGELAFVIAFAMIVLGQILDRGEADLVLQSRRTHPPPVWRALFLSSLLLETIPGKAGVSAEAIEHRVNEAWTESEYVASALQLMPGRWRNQPRDEDDLKRARHLEEYEIMRSRYITFVSNVIDPLAAKITSPM